MELTKINGNTYFIKAPTNIGVYTYKNKGCILIDTGISSNFGRRIDKCIVEHNLKPRFIINTHQHTDHCGGNKYFIENYTGCTVYTSEKTKVYMQNDLIGAAVMFSGNPVKELKEKNLYGKVDYTLDPGINKINDEKFNIIDLNGHIDGQIGIVTPDKVCFVGDSVFSSEIIKKYSFPYLFDVGASLDSMERLKEIEEEYFVVSHSEKVYEREEFIKLIQENIENIEKYNEQILQFLNEPMTREELLQSIMLLNDLSGNYKQYHLYFNTVSSFISYLYDKGFIKYSIEDGKLYYYV